MQMGKETEKWNLWKASSCQPTEFDVLPWQCKNSSYSLCQPGWCFPHFFLWQEMWDFEISVLHGERDGAEKHRTLADLLRVLESHCAAVSLYRRVWALLPAMHRRVEVWAMTGVLPGNTLRSNLTGCCCFWSSSFDTTVLNLFCQEKRIISESRGNLDNLALAECEFCSSAFFLIPLLKAARGNGSFALCRLQRAVVMQQNQK